VSPFVLILLAPAYGVLPLSYIDVLNLDYGIRCFIKQQAQGSCHVGVVL
jgi:hypothetical protein